MHAQEPLDSLATYLGLRGFVVQEVRIESAPKAGDPHRRIKILTLLDTRRCHACPDCGRYHEPLFQESAPILIRDCTIGDFETFLEIRPYRVACCGGTRVERLPFKAPGHRMTRRFFERLAALCRRLPVLEVATMAGLSQDTVARIDKEATELALGGPEPFLGDRIRWIGIDEVSRTGGHQYFTIVTDLERGTVLWVGDGKGEEGLAPFFDKLGPKKTRRIKGVVADLGYRTSIERWLPHAVYLLDRFHIVQWVNEALQKLRRRLFGGAPRDGAGKAIKGQKWLLLKARENLRHSEKLRLRTLLEMNRPLFKAYVLKEQLRRLLHHPWKYLNVLRAHIRDWCRAMSVSRIPELRTVARRLRESLERIVLRYRHPDIPMGLVETTNRTIGDLRRQAHGFRDVEHYKLKIYQRCSIPHDPWRAILL